MKSFLTRMPRKLLRRIALELLGHNRGNLVTELLVYCRERCLDADCLRARYPELQK